MMMLKTSKQAPHALLVEDNPDHARLIQLAIEEEWQYTHLHLAPNGLYAMNHLRDQEQPLPDLILLDLKMPEMNGHDFLAAIKLHSKWREIPVVVLTTSMTPEDRTLAYQHHANSYLVKPADAAGFRRLIREIRYYWHNLNQPPGDKPLRCSPSERG